MSTTISDSDNSRRITIDGSNPRCPESVFISREGVCLEFPKERFIQALKREFGLLEPLEVGLERFMASIAA